MMEEKRQANRRWDGKGRIMPSISWIDVDVELCRDVRMWGWREGIREGKGEEGKVMTQEFGIVKSNDTKQLPDDRRGKKVSETDSSDNIHYFLGKFSNNAKKIIGSKQYKQASR